MTWSETYNSDNNPTATQISHFISNPLWNELCQFIEQKYDILPNIEYSKCTMARGWNVKYKKKGKSICTLYPNEGYFTCLIVISEKHQMEAELIINNCDKYIQDIYANTKLSMGGKWLMIDVTNEKLLIDLKEFIGLKAK